VLGDDARLKDLRDVALMMVGRDLLARASELVGLTVEAVQFDADGALVALRRRKTSTETMTYQIGPGAAAALHRWLGAAGIKSGLVFRSTTKGGNTLKPRALSVRDVGRVLKGLAARAKFDQTRVAALSGHSMRVGMACDLVAANVDSAAIMQAAGWSTPRMLARYTQRLDAKRGAIARYYKL
jgi:integrase